MTRLSAVLTGVLTLITPVAALAQSHVAIGWSRADVDFDARLGNGVWSGSVPVITVSAGKFVRPGISVDAEVSVPGAMPAQRKTPVGYFEGGTPALTPPEITTLLNLGYADTAPTSALGASVSLAAYDTLTNRLAIGFRAGLGVRKLDRGMTEEYAAVRSASDFDLRTRTFSTTSGGLFFTIGTELAIRVLPRLSVVPDVQLEERTGLIVGRTDHLRMFRTGMRLQVGF